MSIVELPPRLGGGSLLDTALLPAGGGGTTVKVKRAKPNAGNITLNNSPGAWVQVTGAPTLAIAAAIGDYVSFEILEMMLQPAGFLDLAVVVSSAAVRYCATETSTPGVEGNPAFYPQPGTYRHYGPTMEFVVTSGDLSGGNVTVAFWCKGNGTGVLYGDTTYPLKWRAVNYGAINVT